VADALARLSPAVSVAATRCNTLQHVETYCNSTITTHLPLDQEGLGSQQRHHLGTYECDCNTLQHTATRCNILQHHHHQPATRPRGPREPAATSTSCSMH